MRLLIVRGFTIDVDEPTTEDERVYEGLVHAQIVEAMTPVLEFALRVVLEGHDSPMIKSVGGDYLLVGQEHD